MIEQLGPGSGMLPIRGEPFLNGYLWECVKPGETPLELRAKSLAHLLVFALCFGIQDLHPENLVWDGTFGRVLDGECFGTQVNGLQKLRNPDQAELMLFRFGCSMLETFVAKDRELLTLIPEHLPMALQCVEDAWPRLFEIRQSLTGVPSRVILRRTSDYSKMMPYAIDANFRPLLLAEIASTAPDLCLEVPEDTVNQLARGIIPRHTLPLPSTSEPICRAIEPSIEMQHAIEAWFCAADQSPQKARAVLKGSIYEIDGRPFIATAIETDADRSDLPFLQISVNDCSLVSGILGLDLLRRIEKALRIQPSTPDEVQPCLDQIPSLILQHSSKGPNNNGLHGLGGHLAYAWMLWQMGELTPTLRMNLQECITRVSTAGPVGGLWDGLPGLLHGLTLAQEYIGPQPLRSKLRERILAEADIFLREDFGKAWPTVPLGISSGVCGLTLALLHASPPFPEQIGQLLVALQQWLESHSEDPDPAARLAAHDIADLISHASELEPTLFGTKPDFTSGFKGLGTMSHFKNPAHESTRNLPGFLMGWAGSKFCELAPRLGLKDPIFCRPIFGPTHSGQPQLM